MAILNHRADVKLEDTPVVSRFANRAAVTLADAARQIPMPLG
jgi:hypothetical protein